MLKKTIRFEDLDGNVITEDFWFHLSRAELVELEVSEKNGLAETLKAIVESENGAQIIEHFKNIILLSYGVRGEDGRRFIKSAELRDAFAQTNAYSELFIELATDANAASTFVKGIMPANVMPSEADVISGSVQTNMPLPTSLPGTIPTAKPASEMTREELLSALSKKNDEPAAE